MIVFSCQVDLHLPESRSLKQKRQVIKSLKDRLHDRFNVSVAEVEHQELWQRGTLGMAIVSTATSHANEVMSKAMDFIQNDGRVYIIDYQLESR